MIKLNKYELELIFPTKEYKKEVEEYLQEFLDNGENEIAGDGGLDRRRCGRNNFRCFYSYME